jgi:hypothetical protein
MAGVFAAPELEAVIGERISAPGFSVRDFRPDDRPVVLDIARELTGDLQSKFTLTPHLSRERARRYYLQAIENACNGEHIDDFLVLVRDDEPVGLATYRRDRHLSEASGREITFWTMFGLRRDLRREAVGRRFSELVNGALMRERGVDVIQWKTMLHNRGALKMVMKRSYRPRVEYRYTFHKVL